MMCALPPDVLELVLLHVAYSLEVDGVRGPTIVVRDVLSALSTCTALRRSIASAHTICCSIASQVTSPKHVTSEYAHRLRLRTGHLITIEHD